MPPVVSRDVVIPIVFPDYRIKVSEPLVIFDLDLDPVKINGKRVFDGYKTKGVEVFDGKVEDLGHAGALIIPGGRPHTKVRARYFEYGRYDKEEKGVTREVRGLPRVTLGKDGRPTEKSLRRVLYRVAHKAGHGTRIQATYIEVPGKFDRMEKYMGRRKTLNKNSKREVYSIWTNSCLHFMKQTAEAGGVEAPVLVDPTPASYADEMQDNFPDLDYDPRTKKLRIEPGPNVPEWVKR